MLEDIQKQVIMDLDKIPTHDNEEFDDYEEDEYLSEEESEPAPAPAKKPKQPTPRKPIEDKKPAIKKNNPKPVAPEPSSKEETKTRSNFDTLESNISSSSSKRANPEPESNPHFNHHRARA